MALNIYYEANAEPLEGKYAVAHVVLNRMQESREGACTVIYKPSQFSWTLTPQAAPTGLGWLEAKIIAREVLNGKSTDPTCGSTFFHAQGVRPSWAKKLKKVTRIGMHIFYRDAGPIAHYIENNDVKHFSFFRLRLGPYFHSKKPHLQLSFHKYNYGQKSQQLFNRSSSCWV